jgi:hypothetical protein
VEDTLNRSRYFQVVDPIFLEERENFDCNAEAANFFSCICNNFNTISVGEGVFRFVYVWGKALKREKEI